MVAFLTKNIVPKLEGALSSLPITPHNQDLTLWQAVMDWADLLPPPQLAQVLAQVFFPRWLQVLAGWLNSTPNYEEVVRWYSGWKGSLPAAVLPLPGVAEQLSQALHMMNRSVTGGGPLAGQPGALENVRYMTSRELGGVQEMGTRDRLGAGPEVVRTAAQVPQGFKDLIARRCEERGIVFRPLPGRWREGKQLYLCGSRQVYLDRNVIFVMEGGTGVWVPTSLNNLLDRAA
jgi:tuftelin-interacting protein 11